MEELCEHCSPVAETKSEYEEWAENGCQKAAKIIESVTDTAK